MKNEINRLLIDLYFKEVQEKRISIEKNLISLGFILVYATDLEAMVSLEKFKILCNSFFSSANLNEIMNIAAQVIQMKRQCALKFLVENCPGIIEHQDECHRNLLHYACQFGAEEAINYLCDKKINVEAPDCQNRTPLDFAVIFNQSRAALLHKSFLGRILAIQSLNSCNHVAFRHPKRCHFI